MPGDVTTPHDALFERVFSDIEQGGALLRQLLPPDLVAAVDWPSLRPVPTSLVPPELRELESVFSYLVIISREGEGLIEQVAQVLHPGAKRDAMDL
ncbi:MAG: Rpn family recombination-promoting nuclease/putative transposase, partial [Sandaracinaceae bacterium]